MALDGELLLAGLAGVGGMLGWGLADFFAKKTIDQVGDVTTLFWGQLIGIAPLVALLPAGGKLPVLSLGGWTYAAVLGVWSGLSYIPTYVAFGKGKVSLLSPIFATYAVVVALLSALFFHEIIPVGRGVAFVVVFAGIFLINGDLHGLWSLLTRGEGRATVRVDGLGEILLAICLYSVWLIALDRFVVGRNWIPILLVIRVFSALSLFAYSKARRIRLSVRGAGVWKYLILIGVFDVAAFACVSFGFSATHFVSVVAMLSAAFSLPTIVLARFALGERTTRTQRVGSLIIVAGVMALFA